MKLVNRFYIRDIKDYERDNNKSILKMFETAEIDNLVELIALGNHNCTEEHACELLDQFLSEGNSTLNAFDVIKKALFGEQVDKPSSDSDNPKDYESLSDLYQDYCMQLMSNGLTHTEFYNLDTLEMYKIVNSIKMKVINDMNRELTNEHNLSIMIGNAVWGKASKEAPQVSLSDDGAKQRLVNKQSEAALHSFLAKKGVNVDDNE